MFYQAEIHYKSRIALVEQLFAIYPAMVAMPASKDNRTRAVQSR